jgi:hypothetical protein
LDFLLRYSHIFMQNIIYFKCFVCDQVTVLV